MASLDENLTDDQLADAIASSHGTEDVVQTTLRTDGRVLARITDGIYRQPASALRELISNSYDADAERVVINTDRPRFHHMTIEDDGIGMSPQAVAHLLHHIGGSAKRSLDGVDLGITQDADSLVSPSGRRLIGKIGIGLFSVAQLTQSFQIITKKAGDECRTIASVTLKQFSENPRLHASAQYEAGRVSIWREHAPDVDAQGTTIVLHNVRPKARETLQSAGHWARVRDHGTDPPRFHIGHFRAGSENELELDRGSLDRLPWRSGDSPLDAFRSLVDVIPGELRRSTQNPKLDQIFDYYLQMVWQLSLAIPAPYVDGHPFDIELDGTLPFELPGSQPASARPIEQKSDDRSIRAALGLERLASEGKGRFRVVLDDLELRRPLRFVDLPKTSNAVKTPMLFVGGLREEFDDVAEEVSGGPLEFQAYLLWAPRIAPVEHVGSLVRIHGASGTLFDPTFLRFQVSEPTRLRQISCEVFVSEGLEAALNIDRESYNYAHPHVVRLTSWLHAALTRVINQQKQVASRVRRQAREAAAEEEADVLRELVEDEWIEVAGDDDDLPDVTLGLSPLDEAPEGYWFDRTLVLGDHAHSTSGTAVTLKRRIVALVQLLDAYGAFSDLTSEESERLVQRIGEILRSGG